jgi:hypothetical protein
LISRKFAFSSPARLSNLARIPLPDHPTANQRQPRLPMRFLETGWRPGQRSRWVSEREGWARFYASLPSPAVSITMMTVICFVGREEGL